MGRKKEIAELTIESVAFGGQGVARLNNMTVFVQGGLPDDRVMAEVYHRRKKHAEARILEIISPSPDRVDADCPHFAFCGGCKIQTLQYNAQLREKRQQVLDSLERIGGFLGITVEPTLPSPLQFYYRNKMEFSFSAQRWLTPAEINGEPYLVDKHFALGLHPPGFFDKVVDLKTCLLQSERSAEIVNWIRDYARANSLKPYHITEHAGFLRNLMIREGKNTKQRMVNLVTWSYQMDIMNAFAESFMAVFPETTSLLNNVNSALSNTAIGEQEYILAGTSVIEETLGPWRFRISANSFFQTNTIQAERLYYVVKELAGLTGQEIVYDLYCGTGTIAIFLSDSARQVIGFELIESCLQDARVNADLNNVDNCRFIRADLKYLADFTTDLARPTVMIIDPPRAGMHRKTVESVLALRPDRIVHVSCNPTTLARDLVILVEGGYDIEYVQPVDMFPHTGHVEVVVRLEKSRIGG